MCEPEPRPTTANTRIILIRHGHVEGIAPPRFRGRTDLALTEQGVRQAERTRDYLARVVRPAAIYTSPLSRCIRTGAILAEPHGLTPRTLDAFTDIDYGAWQGKSYREVEAAEPASFRRWMNVPHLAVIPGGEDLHGVTARIAAALRTILAQHRGETVFLVGHDSVNRVLLCLALELPLSRFWHLRQTPCGVSDLDYDDGFGCTIRSVNGTAHLAGLDAGPSIPAR